MPTFTRWPLATAPIVFLCMGIVTESAESPAGLFPDDARQIDRDLSKLNGRLLTLQGDKSLTANQKDQIADIEVFRKAVVWALRHETKLNPADVALIKKAITRGLERAETLAAGK